MKRYNNEFFYDRKERNLIPNNIKVSDSLDNKEEYNKNQNLQNYKGYFNEIQNSNNSNTSRANFDINDYYKNNNKDNTNNNNDNVVYIPKKKKSL